MLSTAKEVKAQNGGCAETIDGRDVTSLGVIHLPNGKHAVFINERGSKRTVMVIDVTLPLVVSWVSWLGDTFSDVFSVMSEGLDGTTESVYQPGEVPPGADALAPPRRIRDDDL